jgi:hypothetical protein
LVKDYEVYATSSIPSFRHGKCWAELASG